MPWALAFEDMGVDVARPLDGRVEVAMAGMICFLFDRS